jgi:transcriptional regulator with XRE-family HTH domain
MPVAVILRLETFGERLRARRLELGLSATSVAAQAGTSRGTLYRIERGRQTASLDLERRLRTLLGLQVTG